MDGFVKVLKKKNLNDVKRYFFYLTYNGRADLEVIFNRPEINKMEEINKLTSSGKLNNKNTLSLDNPYSSYYSYRNELRNEWKADRVKQLELIMSYSKLVNEFMFYVLGQVEWEKEYRQIVVSIMKKHFKKNRHIMCYFHKLDSTGYRYHSHILLYPYENNINGFPMVYSHIEEKKLKQIKEDFSKSLGELVNREKERIRRSIVGRIKKSSKEKIPSPDGKIFDVFLNKNKEIKQLFTSFI